MMGGLTPDEDLVRRLPLPLAQLYRRAHNAKTPLDRHNAAYCLWEAALKLLGSVAIVAYAERGAVAPELADRLQNLGAASLGTLVGVRPAPRAAAGRGRRRGVPPGARSSSSVASATTCHAPPGSTPPSARPSMAPLAAVSRSGLANCSSGWSDTATRSWDTAPRASETPRSTIGWAGPSCSGWARSLVGSMCSPAADLSTSPTCAARRRATG